MSLQNLPAAARRYVQAVLLLGTPGLLAVVITGGVPWSPAILAAMLAAALLGSQKLILVGTPGAPGSRTHLMSTLSLGFPIVLGSVVWSGAYGAMMVGVASGLGASLYPRRHPLYRAWFTVVNLGASALVAGGLMDRWGSVGGPTQLAASPLGFAAGTLAYYLLNTGMVSTAVALSQGASPWATWRREYLWTAPSYLAGAAIVAGASFFYVHFGAAVAWLSLACLYLVHLSYKCYLDKVHQLQVNERRLQEVCMAAVESLALAIDAKDCGTHSHIRRVQQIAVALGEHAGVSPEELQAIRVASLTHDVGKLAVPETILSKAGRLSSEEFERVKAHVSIGASILEPVQFPWPVIEIVRTHHERWDGLGYPAGVKGEEIPLGGRVVAIADVFDALTSPRPYRTALSYDEAHAVIRAGSGTHFDPRLVQAFTEIFPELLVLLTGDETRAGGGVAGEPVGATARRAHVWDEIREASQESLSVAFTDPLTSLGNGRHLAAALPRELELAQREGRALAVLMMDLDGFKEINDQCGHLAGDAALQMVARVVREAVREDSTVCRYAGDEFVVLLPGTRREHAERAAERLSALVEQCDVPGTRRRVGLSVGVASYPQDGTEAAALLATADRNMYAQKWLRKAGRLSGEGGSAEGPAGAFAHPRITEGAGPSRDGR